MRILIITRNLPPLVGGMERLNWHMAEELNRFAEVRMVGPAASAALGPEGVTVTEARLNPLWRFLLDAQWHACRQARRWRPDWIIAGSGLTAPLAWLAAKICGARTAVYVHGLDLSVRQPVYRCLWLPAIRRMDCVIANSRATETIAIDAGLDPERISIVHPGVDVRDATSANAHGALFPRSSLQAEPIAPVTAAGESAKSDSALHFRKKNGLGDRPLLLSVGRLSARKGLREFVAQALPDIIAATPDAVLLIVGDAPSDALHARAQTPDSIRAAADAHGLGDHIRFLGRLPEAELPAAYLSANVHIFPIRDIPGDPEGFGMVAVEAAAHGLATVAFATGGVVDAVAEGKSGHLVPAGDHAAFAAAVLQTLAEQDAMRDSCMTFARQFAWSAFGTRIAALLSGVTTATPSATGRSRS